MVGRRRQREMRMHLGEALATGGLVALVLTPLVYRAHTAMRHMVVRRSLVWPTVWMWAPLVVTLIGLVVWLWNSSLLYVLKSRRKPMSESPSVDASAAAGERV